MTELVKTETPLFACPKSPLSVTSSDRGVWRHKKRGTTYTIIGEAVAQASNGPIVDGEPVTIYRGEEGWVWVRNTIEFHDGRFERVSDGDAKHEDAQAAEPVGCQRGGEAETPHLSPDTLTQSEPVAWQFEEHGGTWQFCTKSEYERFQQDGWQVRALYSESTLLTLSRQVEDLTRERDEAVRQEALCRADGNVQIGLRKSAEAALTASQAQAEALRGYLDEIEVISDRCVNEEFYSAKEALYDLSNIRSVIKRSALSLPTPARDIKTKGESK